MMIDTAESKKQILKSSILIGGASIITILVGLIKNKVAAEFLGPEGIGLLGLMVTTMSLGATIFGMGLNNSGVKEIAFQKDNDGDLIITKYSIIFINLFLGLLAMIIILPSMSYLSIFLFDSENYNFHFFILGLGILFSILSNSPQIILQGERRIIELAKTKILGAFFSAILGISLIILYNKSSLSLFVISVPFFTLLFGFYYSDIFYFIRQTKIPRFSILIAKWHSLFLLGFAFMLTQILTILSQLIVRSIIGKELDLNSLGYFQAAWQISMTYISFILIAMASDYFPRLSSIINKKVESNRLINEQLEISLVFSAPFLLLFLTISPLIINLLYSSQFSESIIILRWQIYGDLFKIISWPLSFVLLAKGKGKVFFMVELIWNALYVGLVYLGINKFGLNITGYAFFISFIIYSIIVLRIVNKSNKFIFSKQNTIFIFLLILFLGLILSSTYISEVFSLIFGGTISIISIFFTLESINKLNINNGKIKKILECYNKIKFW